MTIFYEMRSMKLSAGRGVYQEYTLIHDLKPYGMFYDSRSITSYTACVIRAVANLAPIVWKIGRPCFILIKITEIMAIVLLQYNIGHRLTMRYLHTQFIRIYFARLKAMRYVR